MKVVMKKVKFTNIEINGQKLKELHVFYDKEGIGEHYSFYCLRHEYATLRYDLMIKNTKVVLKHYVTLLSVWGILSTKKERQEKRLFDMSRCGIICSQWRNRHEFEL